MRRATWIGCVGSVGGYCPRSSRTSSVFSGSACDRDDPVELVVLVEQVDHEVARERGHRELGDRGERLLPVERLATSSSFARARKRSVSSARLRRVTSARIATADTIAPSASRTGAALISRVRVSAFRVISRRSPIVTSPRLERTLERPARRGDVARTMVVADGDGSTPDALELVVQQHDVVVGVGDGDAKRQLRDHRLQLCERVLRAAVEADKVERERDAPRELRDELEVLVPVAAGLGRGDREHTEPRAARFERDDDERAGLHPDELLLTGTRDGLQRSRQRRAVDRVAGTEDLDDGDAPVALDVVDRVDLVEEGRDARLDVGVRDANELGVGVPADVDMAAVGDPRHDELRHLPQELLVVEGLAQLLRRLEQQRQPCARGLGLVPGIRFQRDESPDGVIDALGRARKRLRLRCSLLSPPVRSLLVGVCPICARMATARALRGPERPKRGAGECVCLGVRLTRHPCDLDFSEPFHQRIRLLVEGLQMFRFDLPRAVQLVDDQGGVEANAQVAYPASECLLEPSDQSSVLRDVVILHPSDRLGDLLDGRLQHHADRSFARSPPGLILDDAPIALEQVVAGTRGVRHRANVVAPLDGVSNGPCRDRTCDLGIKSPLLYQLS